MTTHRALPALFVALVAAPAPAQPGEVKPDTTWVFDASAAHPGTTIHAALQVEFPGKWHVQSNQPADDFLIPTVLTLAPPPGCTVR